MCDMDKYEKVAVVLLFAILIVWVWRSIPNSPKVYPGGRRLHHGLIGAVLVVVGLLSKKSYIMAFGAILAVDDIEDLPHWLDFEQRSDPNELHAV